MCHALITRCVECEKLIDSVLKPCQRHSFIKINDKAIGYCPRNKSLDGYAIDPATGKPFPPKQPLLQLEGEYYRHRVKQMTSLCFWCRGIMSREEFENKRSDYYNRCSDIADVVSDERGVCQVQEPQFRHELWDFSDNGVKDYRAYYRPKDDAAVGLVAVANGSAREATHRPPINMCTRQEDFLWFEPDEVVRPEFPVEDLWERSQAECPLMNLLVSSERSLKRNRATVEAATTPESPTKKARPETKQAVRSARPLPLAFRPANTLGAPPHDTLERPPIVGAMIAAALPQDQHYNLVPTLVPAEPPVDTLESVFGDINHLEFLPVDEVTTQFGLTQAQHYDGAPAHPDDVPFNILYHDVFEIPPVDEATTAAVLNQDQHYNPLPADPLDEIEFGPLPEVNFYDVLGDPSYLDTTTTNAPPQNQFPHQDSGFYDGPRLKTPDLNPIDNMFQDLDDFNVDNMFPDV